MNATSSGIVVVHRDPYLRDKLAEWASAPSLGYDGPTTTLADLDDATIDALAMPPSLLVVATSGSSPVWRHQCSRLATLRARWSRMPICVVATMELADSNPISPLAPAALVLEGGRLQDDFHRELRHMRVAGGGHRPNTGHLVCFHLAASGDCSCQIRSFNTADRRDGEVRFNVPPDRLRRLAEASSRLLDDRLHWRDAHRKIGEELVQALIDEHPRIKLDLRALGAGDGGDRGNVKICFTVDRPLYPIAVESIGYLGATDCYWLEKAPLWRQLPTRPAELKPLLFTDDDTRSQPVDCLLIDGRCSGAVSLHGQTIGLSDLPGAPGEIECVRRELAHNMPVRVGRICRVSLVSGQVRTELLLAANSQPAIEDHPDDFETVLERLLCDGKPWHVVHFAGHSHCFAQNDHEHPYVFLPAVTARNSSDPVPVGIVKLARWLRNSRFVYLSSCVSAHHDFVHYLCLNAVPAMSGFRWSVADEEASQYSERFYRKLFKYQSLESGLHETWRETYEDLRHAPVWASSQFVLQGELA